MAKITANNILTGSVTLDKLDSSVASNLAAADNTNTIATIAASVAAAAFETANNNAALLANLNAPLITNVQIADSSYNVLDDTAANTTGGFIVITGSGFTNSSIVVFGSTASPAVSYVNSTTLQAQVPALTAASYPVYVVNSNGGTAIKINGLTTSSFPAWSTDATLTRGYDDTFFSVVLNATSDSNLTYANTSVLPDGTTLLANGYFFGTFTVASETTYTFDVRVTDAELQDVSRTFSITVNKFRPGIYSWGANGDGQLGQNDIIQRSSPTQVGRNTNWSFVAVGSYFVMASTTNGALWAWGSNTNGRLGFNDLAANNRSSPTQVGLLTNWSDNIAAQDCVWAIKTNGTLWSWGLNSQGQLGSNNVITRSSPTQVGAASDWRQVSGGSGSAVATKTNGTLWSWGGNTFAQLGSNNIFQRSSPAQVGGASDWLQVLMSSGGHALALKTNGTLWSWGQNNGGNLGNNSGSVIRSSPAQVGALTNWSKIHPAGSNSFAIKTDGTLWSFGQNSRGSLGQNDIIQRSSPTQVGTDTNWSKFAKGLGNNEVLALRTDGSLWSWGLDTSGQLGLDSGIPYRSSPTQVGVHYGWSDAFTGRTFSFGKI